MAHVYADQCADEDLDLIFSRFGKILSCEVIRDKMTGDSLQYAFIEFENQKDCEQAYFKMQDVLIDDHRIHVDFSQSVSVAALSNSTYLMLDRSRSFLTPGAHLRIAKELVKGVGLAAYLVWRRKGSIEPQKGTNDGLWRTGITWSLIKTINDDSNMNHEIVLFHGKLQDVEVEVPKQPRDVDLPVIDIEAETQQESVVMTSATIGPDDKALYQEPRVSPSFRGEGH
jgi:RNA recognition motif-containing protein